MFFPVRRVARRRAAHHHAVGSGIVWFNDEAMTATSPDGDKLYADGSGGWTAYVLNGNLFLKKFADQPASAQPAMEGEIDIYPGARLPRVRGPGPLHAHPGGRQPALVHRVEVVKLPSSVSVAVGSSSLVDFALQQLAN